MSRKALTVVAELRFRAVSCPGVHLSAKDDIYLSICFMGHYRRSECLPAIFPLLFHEKMAFEKTFRHAVDPGDIAVMLEYETVRIELVQLIPPVGDTLACFEEDTRRFLFPEPKLVPSFSGVDREVLMTRAPHFPGIAPRLEFSTKTTIIECSADAEISSDPNVLMRSVIKRNRKHSSRTRTTSSPQRKQPQNLGRRQGVRASRERHGSTRSPSYIPRSQSLSPLRTGNVPRLARLSQDSAAPDGTRTSQPVAGVSEDDSSSSETHDPPDHHHGPDPPRLWQSHREQARLSRSQSSSHREWEEVQRRVRGLLTTPKAVQRLVYGATHSEIDKVLARRSISPGPP